MQRNLEGISTDALNWFMNHDYPGNVRELENLVERAVTLESGTMLSAANLPGSKPKPAEPASESDLPDEGIDLEQATADLERKLIGAALSRTGGVRKDAAKLLGISLRSLRYRLEKLGIEVGPGGTLDAASTPSSTESG
jgi:two-component system response regulator PilR (NtrC family)